MIFKNKIQLIFLLILIFGMGIFFILINKRFAKKETSTLVIPTEVLIPTVNSSVKVDFKPLKKGEIVLTVANEPKGTKEIDFELSYKVANTDLSEGGEGIIEQGVIGKCFKIGEYWQCGEENDDKSGRKIVLGTCSSGVCRYHNIVGPIKLNLKFTGNYGEKIYEKEFKI